MRRIVVVLFLISVFMLPVESVAHGPEWYWSDICEQKHTLVIEVLLASKAEYRWSVSICQLDSAPSKRHPTVVFDFRGGQVFKGEYRTTGRDTIEGNIWQAGADADDLLFGLSFVNKSKNQVLLNTVHIAYPDRASTTKIGRDMIIKTFPQPKSPTPKPK